ncbi:SEC-C metal-binding domain-containing protein, partial [Actinomadura bangladeshensis]
TLAWPPERNAPCWCGSGRKYKKCCGSPTDR